MTNRFNKHLLPQLARDVADLCRPIFHKFPFCIVNFIRVYDDGRVIYLCDNHEWIKNYLNNGYPSIGAFEQQQEFRKQKYVLWDALSDSDPIVISSRKMFNIKFGITIVRNGIDYHDFFNFGSDEEERSVFELIVTKLDELEVFIQEFYAKSQKLIKAAFSQRYYLRDFRLIPSDQIMQSGQVYLGPNYDYQHLTKKEIICLQDLMKGMSIPEIAMLRATSIRTLEKHLEHIKAKLQCKTQFELGYLAAKFELDQIKLR